MAFRRLTGKTKIMYFPKKASTAFAEGDLVYFDGAGAVQPADATSGMHVGVCRKAVVSTDDDYASTTKIPIEVPVERWVEWEVDAVSAVAADVGDEIDLTDAATADRSASAKDALLVTRYISATKIGVTILSNADIKDTATT